MCSICTPIHSNKSVPYKRGVMEWNGIDYHWMDSIIILYSLLIKENFNFDVGPCEYGLE